jgi:uncharacterized coiled-coil protein SlyX
MSTVSDWPMANTQHGMLIAFGEFLNQHGVIERLMDVAIGQKTRRFAPQTKLVEFLAGIMSGMEYLEDLNDGPHPLVQDRLVARAWGQAGFAHYSGVSRTLEACDEQTVQDVERVITEFSRPFIASAMQDLLRRGAPIIYDFDLTGQAVSSTSTTYPEVTFGWMDDGIKLGYQLARVCVRTHDGVRFWVAGFHHPGDTVSIACLKELVLAAEAQTCVRPRRRTELVEQRIATQTEVVTRLRRLVAEQQAKLHSLQQTAQTLTGKTYHARQIMKEAASPQKVGRLAAQLEGWQKRQPRLAAQMTRCQQVLLTHQTRLAEQERTLAELQAWQAQLVADNQANPDPPPYVEARMDAGFTSGETLTWLLEMGYCPNTKAPNDRTTAALRKRLSPDTAWTPVGSNADMIAWGDYYLHGCPFPLTVALERFKVGQAYHYATLIHYRDDGVFPTLPAWFQHYNERQTIEAGNKEMKGTFFVQHLMSRSLPGIQIQVLFTGLAANTVRWCRPWLKSCSTHVTGAWTRTLDSPKHLVRVAANTAALVQDTQCGTAMQFAPDSPFPGVTLFMKGVPAFQLALGFNQPYKIESG